MFLVHVNYLAVALCGVLSMVVGFIWYGPLFGKEWMKLVGMKKRKMSDANADMPKTYGLMFLCSLLMAYVLAHIEWYAAPGSLTMMIAVKTAIWVWLGFVATTGFMKFLTLPEKKPLKLFIIETGYNFVNLVLMGVVFGLLK
jgi:hypothetical protein